ncbi:unnamed protein product, partial [Meganyctiphanes norvegica]
MVSSFIWLMHLLNEDCAVWTLLAALLEKTTQPLKLVYLLNKRKYEQNDFLIYSLGGHSYFGAEKTPLTFLLIFSLIDYWDLSLPAVFLAEILTVVLLASVYYCFDKPELVRQKGAVTQYASDASELVLKAASLNEGVLYVAAAYLFCPYTVASCVAKTTTVFANMILAAAFVAMLNGYSMVFGCLIGLATYQSFYPVCLLVPGVLHFIQQLSGKVLVRPIGAFLGSFILLLLISAEIAGSWEFIEATYGFILAAPDLTPNIGLFWYFFTEMFEHFRLFFLATFQINAFVYVLPLSIRLRDDPMLLGTALLAFTAIFRSYPSLGDVGLYLALLPCWKHLYPFMRQTFIVGCMFVATSVLGPIMYNLWIFNGSANANFYFAVTLAFNTAQIFLVTDLLFAHVKREYHLFAGTKMELDGCAARLTLE